MATETMERVSVALKIENLEDLYLAERGLIPADRVRRIEVDNALVDPGVRMISMSKGLIQQLGLKPLRSRTTMTRAGVVTVQPYGPTRLTIQGRDCPMDVTEVPDDGSVLIGSIPLLALDLVVDPVGRQVTGNPAHGGEWVIELY